MTDEPREAAIGRVEALYSLEFGWRAEFDDPRREWRRLFAETFGASSSSSRAPGLRWSTRRAAV